MSLENNIQEEEKLTEEYFNYQENKALKKAKGLLDFNKFTNCKTGFIIKNKKTERIVEIKAPSIEIAAKIVGWRTRHTILIEEVSY